MFYGIIFILFRIRCFMCFLVGGEGWLESFSLFWDVMIGNKDNGGIGELDLFN